MPPPLLKGRKKEDLGIYRLVCPLSMHGKITQTNILQPFKNNRVISRSQSEFAKNNSGKILPSFFDKVTRLVDCGNAVGKEYQHFSKLSASSMASLRIKP